MSSEEDLFSVYYPDKTVSENEGNGDVFQSATSAEAADDTGENQENCTSNSQEIHQLVNEQKSQNTVKKTLSEVNTFRRFTEKEMGSKQEITELPAKELVSSDRKISNHSVWKTQISRLLDANTPELFITQLSGHKSSDSLQSYKTARISHQQQMSHILSRSSETSTSAVQNQVVSTPLQAVQQNNQVQTQLPVASFPHVSQSHGVDSTLHLANPSGNPAIFAGANINNCQFQVFNGPVVFEGKKRRRVIIKSDEELD